MSTVSKSDQLLAAAKSMPDAPKTKRSLWVEVLFLVLASSFLLGVFIAPSRESVGLSAIGLMLTMIFMKMPIAVALILPGLLGLFSLNGTRALWNGITEVPYAATANWSLTVIPMFILMGMLLSQSGLTTRIFEAANFILRWLPGGLAVATTSAGTGLAAVSGSTIGATYALAKVGIPEMLRAGYDRRIAVGAVIVAGLPGQLIPPSIFLVIVAGLLDVPVGQQLIAGIVPGLFISGAFVIVLISLALIMPKMFGKASNVAKRTPGSGGSKLKLVWNLWPLVLIMFVVLGGIFGGYLTAVEAGAAGAAISLVLLLWNRRGDAPLKNVVQAARETASSVGALFFVLIGAAILADLIAVTGLGRAFSEWATGMELGRVQFLLLIMIAYLILGMFMDPLSIMVLTIPMLLPTLMALEINLLWFGVFAVLMSELAIITPPVGILSFILHTITRSHEVSLGQEISLKDIFTAVLMFLPVALVIAIVLILIPDIVTWLPDLAAV